MDDVLNDNGTEEFQVQPIDNKQYLTFIMDNEEFGIDIKSVMEIRQWEEPTPLPNVPEYVKGIIILRGAIIPVIDLRHKFSIKRNIPDESTVIIVVKVKNQEKAQTLGMMIDSVSDVYTINDTEIQQSSMLNHLTLEEHVNGMFNANKRIITNLDVLSALTITDHSHMVCN